GNKAVELSPDSSAAKIALSYAQQAAFDIPAARDTLQQAVQQQPNDALALARLAELQLMSGDRKQARESARQAAALDPGLSRTQLTLGYAALAEFDNEAAKTAFKSAIDMSSSDPMAHLGLGLAKISGGDVAAGGRDIEVAVALDSNSALLRSYLGKTYFEEKRAPLDTEQFAIAKQLDPNDPTAYLYDGIAKQTENRPVEAVQDMEKSIELNDNRAIYRGRFLLDQDRAARGVSHARVYRDLGFTQLGINQASESIGLDPSNASAHRFLADTYREVRRHEIARVSEQLQAQMLQDVSLNPIQPSSTETNLNTVTQGGPASTGYNEFTPLFQRNRASATVSALGGSNDTKGGEAVVSGVYNNFSISAGTYHFDSDGWRPNNGLNQDIDNIFAQWAVSPSFNIQAEYRERESEEGDLAFNFDPDDFMQDKTVDRESETARLGLRFSPSINSDVLLSYIQNDRSEKDESSRPDDLLFPDDDFGLRLDERLKTDDEGDQYELQYLWQGKTMNLIAGAAVSEIDRDSTRELDVVDVQGAFGPPGTVIPLAAEQDSDKIDHDRGYLYLNFRPLDSLLFTLGASYEDFDRDEFDESGIYPKLGASWDVNDEITVRAAAFKVMKPVLVANRTLEPTQIVGFNQLFDDINATESKRYAIGVDWDAHRDLTFGAVISKRDMEEPQLQGDTQAVYEDREEENHQLFGYWTPTQSIAVSGKVIYDNYESDEGVATANGSRPLSVRTWSLPLGITYFHPSGVFAGLTGTHVDQKVRRDVNASLADGEDDFFLVDLSAGYRLPKRSGVLSISVKNLFDTEFSYQDDSYREFRDEPATGPYFPDLTILGQLSLSF
ncbi:MAG: TonB-dependent receptor, partial [Pseudomonadota bacterium]